MSIFKSFEDFLNENYNLNERRVVLKRRYTENYPAVTAGKSARVRNKMIESIADGKLTQEEFDAILKEMTTDSKRWMQRNAKYFNVSEDGITLSKFGTRIKNSLRINESESILESTRSYVGRIDKDGTIHAVYVHSDGYPEWVGKVLQNHYQDEKKIDKLLSLGKSGISSLESEISGAPGHSFNRPVKDQTVFYGRDRGQNGDMTISANNYDRFYQDAFNAADYVYLWDEDNKKWVYTDRKNKKNLKNL